MSQNENDGFAQFTATGGELNVPFDFKIADRAEIKIIRKRSGAETTLVLNTDYTIADNQLNQDLGGVAVLIGSATPALASDIYTAILNTPYSRGVLDGSSDFNQSGDFFAATLNKQFDFVIRMINRLARDTGKSLKFSETLNTSTAIITETIASGRALIAGSTPGTFEEGPDASQIASAQGYASAAATSASNAATSETNAQSWATAAQSAATGINWTKARAASTANVNISSPGAAIDGVTLVSGDRVLLKNQSTASQNGIYVWNGAAVAMTRATDMDTWAEVVSKVVQIEEGTVNADLPYMATVNTGGTLESTSITFTLFQAPLQSGAVSTAAKIVDGILTFAKFLSSEIATAAEMLSGAASKLVSAANFKTYMDTYVFSPIATGYVTVSGTTPTLQNQKGALNISVSRTAIGKYRLTFGNALADTNYYAVVTASQGEAAGGNRVTSMGPDPLGTKSTSIFDLYCMLITTGPASVGGDPANFSFAIYKY